MSMQCPPDDGYVGTARAGRAGVPDGVYVAKALGNSIVVQPIRIRAESPIHLCQSGDRCESVRKSHVYRVDTAEYYDVDYISRLHRRIRSSGRAAAIWIDRVRSQFRRVESVGAPQFRAHPQIGGS